MYKIKNDSSPQDTYDHVVSSIVNSDPSPNVCEYNGSGFHKSPAFCAVLHLDEDIAYDCRVTDFSHRLYPRDTFGSGSLKWFKGGSCVDLVSIVGVNFSERIQEIISQDTEATITLHLTNNGLCFMDVPLNVYTDNREVLRQKEVVIPCIACGLSIPDMLFTGPFPEKMMDGDILVSFKDVWVSKIANLKGGKEYLACAGTTLVTGGCMGRMSDSEICKVRVQKGEIVSH